MVDIVMRLALDNTEWVVDLASGFATLFQVTELVNFHGVKTWLEAGELSSQ